MYIDLGIAYYSRNLYDGAIEAICHASDLNPSDPRPYLFLSKMYNVSGGKAREVTKRMKRFTETNPGNARAYYYYALSSWKGTGGGGEGTVDLAEVEALLRKSISLDPRFGDAHLQLGILLQDLHRDQEALPSLRLLSNPNLTSPTPTTVWHRLTSAPATRSAARKNFSFTTSSGSNNNQTENTGATPAIRLHAGIPPQNVFLAGC